MNREQLRQMIVSGNEQLLNSIIGRRVLSDQQRKLLEAGEKFYATPSPESDAALDGILAIYNTL